MQNIIVEVKPQIELMNSILYTSNHSNLVKSSMGFNPMTDTESDYTKKLKNILVSIEKVKHMVWLKK